MKCPAFFLITFPALKPEHEVKVLVIQSCLTLCDSMDCSLPVSSAQGISQARTLERVAVSPGDLPACPALAGGFFTTESARKPYLWHTYLKKSLVI